MIFKFSVSFYIPFHSQDLIRDPSNTVCHNSYDVTYEKLELDQLIIPYLLFGSLFSSLECLLDNVLTW